MKQNKPIILFCLTLLLPAIFVFPSCAPFRNVTYFKDISDTARLVTQDSVRPYEAIIRPGDLLDINVSTINPQATQMFNLGAVAPAQAPEGAASVTAAPASGVTGATRGYPVDKDGTIEFPVLGKIPAAGLTTAELRDTLVSKLAGYLKNPLLTVRFLNYRVTVLGEVARPATYLISDEKASLLDVLGLAGDLTIYGKRNDILVIREEGGKRTFARLDLTSSKVFESPYYYLRQNDVVYVEPNRPKVVTSDDRTMRVISIASGILTILVSVVLITKL